MDRWLNKIICGDCLEVMRELPDKSVDLVVTDPPYNINIAQWDIIPNYEQWIRELFSELKRISRQQIIFFDYTYTRLFEELSNPFERFIWHREGGVS